MLQKEKASEEEADVLSELPQSPVATALRLMREPELPIALHAINHLSDGSKRRIYRTLMSPELLVRFGIHPITWRGPDGDEHLRLTAEPGSRSVKIAARHAADARDPFAYLELSDNAFNGIDVDLVVFNDPAGPRFFTDVEIEAGRTTLFGTVNRNLAEEERAMQAGLAPAQVRAGLRASRLAITQLEAFMMLMGHSAFYAEPLTYLDAWLFERRGFGYVSGRRLMDEIAAGFQPGGGLHRALDGGSLFRRPEQWRTVRGRAWAIHDGILEAIGRTWNDVRMVKQIGQDAGLETFPAAEY